jgi:hypothetical protein
MARTRTPKRPADEGPPHLLVPRDQFSAELGERIASGEELAARAIGSAPELEAARSDYYTWTEYNEELLTRRFTTDGIAKEYRSWAVPAGAIDLDQLATRLASRDSPRSEATVQSDYPHSLPAFTPGARTLAQLSVWPV